MRILLALSSISQIIYGLNKCLFPDKLITFLAGVSMVIVGVFVIIWSVTTKKIKWWDF